MVTIYSIKQCGYCIELKVMLDEANIIFIEKDLSIPENQKEFKKILEKTNIDALPTILVDKKIIAPSISFKTINEAFNIIKTLN